MCFTLIAKGDSKINRGVALSEWVKKSPTNPDGYAIRSLDYSQYVRTMERMEAENSILKLNSEVIHLHFRKSTNMICEDYIHLWKGRGYTFGHNGILYTLRQGNDSLEFMNMIKNEIANRDIEGIKKAIETLDGYGVFTIQYDNGDSMLISKNKSIKVTKINDTNIVFSSDSLSPCDFVESRNIKTIKFRGFRFEEAEATTIETGLKDCKYATTEINDAIIIVNKNGNLTNFLKIENKIKYPFFNYNGRENKYYHKNKRYVKSF